MTTLSLPVTTEGDALGHIVTFLRTLLRERRGVGTHGRSSLVTADGTPVFVVTDVVDEQLQHVVREQQTRADAAGHRGMTSYRFDHATNVGPYLDATWGLVRRGVLRPTPVGDQMNASRVNTIFAVTGYGRMWLERVGDIIPADTGRLGQMLAARGTHLGAGYRARSQEAVQCYHAQAYLACCAMCGAAAESITLALAVARAAAAGQAESEVLAEYRQARGRTVIQNRLTTRRNDYVKRELETFLRLLNYWRDEAAHGAESALTDDEAHTALLLLLSYAIFADTRWSDLTAA